MIDLSNLIKEAENIGFWGIYESVVRWLTPVRYTVIAFCILLVIIIIYFAIFTNYLYLRYFVSFDEYYDWKARKKKKKKEFIEPPQSLMAQEFKSQESDDLFEPVELATDNDWRKIFSRVDTGREMELRLAIIEADKVVNRRFDDMGILGRNLRDKMENLPPDITKKIGKLDSARRVLDELLKSDHLGVSKDTAKKTVEIYQEAYMNLLS